MKNQLDHLPIFDRREYLVRLEECGGEPVVVPIRLGYRRLCVGHMILGLISTTGKGVGV